MQLKQSVSFCHNSARRKKWPGAPDGQIFAGYSVMRAGPARSLFVAAMVLLAAHVTLLVFDPRATLPSNLFILLFPLLGITVCLLGA